MIPCARCGLSEAVYVCEKCGAACCETCSIEAATIDRDGSLLMPLSDSARLCSRCAPPSGGPGARLRAPVGPLVGAGC